MKVLTIIQAIKKYAFLFFMFIINVNAFSQSVSTEWSGSFGSTSADWGYSIVKDHQGNILVAGRFINTVDFDPGPSTYNLTGNGLHTFILKLDANGNFLWVKAVGGNLLGLDKSIAVDIDDNVYLTGNYSGTIDFDPSANTFNLSSVDNSTDAFILKLTSAGQFVWAKSIGGDGYERGSSIAIDHNQNVCIVGNYADTADFDPGPGVYQLISETNSIGSSYDVYILKLDSAGQFIWAKSVGGEQGDYGNSIAVDTLGNIYTTGAYRETADFNPGSGVNNLNSSWWSEDIFVLKLDPAGNYVWAKSMGGTSSGDEGFSIWIDQHERVYVTGAFKSTADFDPSGNTFNLTSGGSDDSFILRLNSDGTLNWAKSVRGSSPNKGRSITTNASGDVYVTGYYFGLTDFDPAAGITYYENSSHYDIYVLKLDSNGLFDWTANMGGSEADFGYSIITGSNDDEIYLTGSFKDTIDLDPGIDTVTHISNGNYDAFVQKLVECKNTGLDIITACGSYTWIDGTTYTSNNFTATHTLTNIAGCDSVITLNLTLNNPTTGDDTIVACDSYTWIDGITYTTSSDTITDTLTNTVGCDSVVTLHLTILESTSSVDSVVACGSYTWINGITYTASTNTVTDTLTNVAGCDSVIHLNLTINQPNSGTDIITACDEYTWIDGLTYTSSNTSATHILSNSNGCDSVVTLNLTILQSSGSVDMVTACQSYTWMDGVTYTASNNTATHILTNVVGCDSVITLNLTINSVDTSAGFDGTLLNANAANASFQWLDCENGYQVITGETGPSYGPDNLGTYAVEITQNTCVDTSRCIVVDGFAGTKAEEMSAILKYYPNPTSDFIFIELPDKDKLQLIQLRTTDGKLVYQREINEDIIKLELPEINGIYFISIVDTNGEVNIFKVIKN